MNMRDNPLSSPDETIRNSERTQAILRNYESQPAKQRLMEKILNVVNDPCAKNPEISAAEIQKILKQPRELF